MKKISFHTSFKKILADVHTPVSIYLRLRDRFRDTILLESTDFHAGENSFSIIGIQAIAGIEIIDASKLEYKLPGQNPEKIEVKKNENLPGLIQQFMNAIQPTEK